MRILSLNTWYGERALELRAFLLSQLDLTDVFCFQEANGDGIEEVMAELFASPQFQTATVSKFIDAHRDYCLYTISKAPVKLLRQQSLLGQNDADTGAALAVEFDIGGKPLVVVNVHGMPYPGDKLDSEGRLRQTEQILAWLSDHSSPIVVCGDFNLLPDTQSVKHFTSAGYQDLIKNYAIPTTRNQLAWDKHPDSKQLFADYAFVSPNLEVTGFSVPDSDASDHLPMIIDVAM